MRRWAPVPVVEVPRSASDEPRDLLCQGWFRVSAFQRMCAVVSRRSGSLRSRGAPRPSGGIWFPPNRAENGDFSGRWFAAVEVIFVGGRLFRWSRCRGAPATSLETSCVRAGFGFQRMCAVVSRRSGSLRSRGAPRPSGKRAPRPSGEKVPRPSGKGRLCSREERSSTSGAYCAISLLTVRFRKFGMNLAALLRNSVWVPTE